MFSSEFDRHEYTLSARFWGVVFGSLIMVGVGAALVSPRTLPYSVPIIFLAVLGAAMRRGQLRSAVPELSADVVSAMAFMGFALMSCLWAERPLDTVEPVLLAIVFVAATTITAKVLFHEPRYNILHISEGFWIGLLAGLLYLLIEMRTDQAIKIFVYNHIGLTPVDLRPPGVFKWSNGRVVNIAPVDLTRNITPITPFLWPALLCLRTSLPQRWYRIVTVLLAGLAIVVVAGSEHETSKLALVVGGIVFLLAKLNARICEKLLRIVWVFACLAPIPLSMAIYRLDLQDSRFFQKSARDRFVIWNNTAEAALRSPIIGVGANAMYAMAGKHLPAQKPPPKWHPHPHNVYLETWFELGAIGAALLTLLGLAVLDKVHRLTDHIRPYAQAAFASAATVAGSSYGTWQIWFIAMFALTSTLMALAVRVDLWSGGRSLQVHSIDDRLLDDHPR